MTRRAFLAFLLSSVGAVFAVPLLRFQPQSEGGSVYSGPYGLALFEGTHDHHRSLRW